LGTYGESRIGLVRKVNEDSFYISEQQDMLAVADGMGGYVGGEVASRTAVEAVAYYVSHYTREEPILLEKAVQYANACVLSKTIIDTSLEGMGTTLTMLQRQGNKMSWAHVGDSRIYVYHQDVLQQITTDHTLVQVLLDTHKITLSEAAVHPQRHVLTRAIGVDKDLTVDTGNFSVFAGDRILLCTDGLTSFVTTQTIQAVLQERENSERQCIHELLDCVYANGAKDNVTAILTTVE